MIPTTSHRVNIGLLDPTLRHRVQLLLNDPRMNGYRVVSAVRTFDEQKRLWSGWRSRLPGFNLAANPYNEIGTTPEGWTFRGSFHMQQDDGWGHAVDLRAPVTHSIKKRWRLIGEVGEQYGLRQTVRSEWWHLQARQISGYFPGPTIPTPTGAARMLLSYGYFTWLNEGWRYRGLSSPTSVAAMKAAGIPHVDLSHGDDPKTLRALLNEAKTAGRLVQSVDFDRVLDQLNAA